MTRRTLIEHDCSNGLLEDFVNTEIPAHNLKLAWLGQAGFLLQWGSQRIVIDPYLSDSLAQKYQGTEFPHVRMMQPPIRADQLCNIDSVLITHAHSDPMDPDTLRPMASANPTCRFVVPAAEHKVANERGVPSDRMAHADDGHEINLGESLRLTPIAAAHEQLKVDAEGQHHFLGYVITDGVSTIYFSGDCVPYDGLQDRLSGHSIDIAILPINGRDDFRRSRGVPGNFQFDEAVELCRSQQIPNLLPCHFGMFEFNTVDADSIASKIATNNNGPRCTLPRVDRWYELVEEYPVEESEHN